MKATITGDSDGRHTLVIEGITLTEIGRMSNALDDYNSRAPGRQSTEDADRAIRKALQVMIQHG